ncbi:hypothetical protein H2198_009631 [Neophaeococcomyces mojaviensis]|uniref:Uncharacterized protein n=1 Tax=Neophaeococcomyces mojaviensis TaxID=3383035 RepID=A0ACC2ZU27_9EURO|nr:hypothetical protein H2198_009631 [Knufia sp. JES_112]
MSAPTDQFAGLSLREMAPSIDEVRRRATELQDILSTYDETNLPSEFQLSKVDNIARPPDDRPPSDQWVDVTTLYGTLLTLGCWDDDWWKLLPRLANPKRRATAFIEKLRRRFTQCFDDYEHFLDSPRSADELKNGIADVAHRICNVFRAIHEDQNTFRIEEAETREADTLRVALEALQRICSFTQPITPTTSAGGPARRTRGRASSTGTANLSLFSAIVRSPADGEGALLLGALEQFTGAALREHKDLLVIISGRLDKPGNAPTEFIERFDALQEKANDESAISKLKAGPSGRKRGLEADPRLGAPFEATPKRGKRTGGR